MASPRRIQPTEVVFHVLNRGVRRLQLFEESGDYEACLRVLSEARRKRPVRLFAYCLMPNHFHLVLQSSSECAVSKFMQWFTATHSKRWHSHRASVGTGAVYQARYKAIAVQPDDGHFLRVCRYVERNPLRAGLVERAETWRWSSLAQRLDPPSYDFPLDDWPIPPPADWTNYVNAPQHATEFDDVRHAIKANKPFGSDDWRVRGSNELGFVSVKSPRGRPLKR